MSKIFIIGGSGFIGTKVCQILNKEINNNNFCIYDKKNSNHFPEKSKLIDIRTTDFIKKIEFIEESIIINQSSLNSRTVT